MRYIESRNMQDLKGKKVLVVGLGQSGLAAAKYLADQGAFVTVTDTKKEEELKVKIDELESVLSSPITNARTQERKNASTIQYHFGSNPPSLFTETGLIVLSPGVPLDVEGVLIAKKNNIPIVCEMELGLERLKGKVIAITGTNGKSTTTALVGHLLQTAGIKTWVGGNIGRPLISDMSGAESSDYIVLEMSSYQLELVPSLKAHIAVWLNATPDHLDRYESFDHYVKAKTFIGVHQDENDFVVYNNDDSVVKKEVAKFQSKKLPLSDTKTNSALSNLIGVHNKENIAAASIVAEICGVDQKMINQGLKSFKGLPHRLQFIKEVSGVKYFNDSKGTNIGAVLGSVKSFENPVVLIAGGKDKNTAYSPLREVLSGRVRHLLLIGEAAPKMKDELGDLAPTTLCQSLEEAVDQAAQVSKQGDVVLLSPACSSFDMFKNYEDRGEVFTKCVKELK